MQDTELQQSNSERLNIKSIGKNLPGSPKPFERKCNDPDITQSRIQLQKHYIW